MDYLKIPDESNDFKFWWEVSWISGHTEIFTRKDAFLSKDFSCGFNHEVNAWNSKKNVINKIALVLSMKRTEQTNGVIHEGH